MVCKPRFNDYTAQFHGRSDIVSHGIRVTHSGFVNMWSAAPLERLKILAIDTLYYRDSWGVKKLNVKFASSHPRFILLMIEK